jgi:hypothetical protein
VLEIYLSLPNNQQPLETDEVDKGLMQKARELV